MDHRPSYTSATQSVWHITIRGHEWVVSNNTYLCDRHLLLPIEVSVAPHIIALLHEWAEGQFEVHSSVTASSVMVYEQEGYMLLLTLYERVGTQTMVLAPPDTTFEGVVVTSKTTVLLSASKTPGLLQPANDTTAQS